MFLYFLGPTYVATETFSLAAGFGVPCTKKDELPTNIRQPFEHVT